MVIFFVFLFLLFLENLFLPALIGEGYFLITTIFILGFLAYSSNWKKSLFQGIILFLFQEFFTGADPGSMVIPFIITGSLYLWINRFFNFTEQLRENLSFFSIIFSTLLLIFLSLSYSFFSTLHHTSYDFSLDLNQLTDFFQSSLISLMGWSGGISILYKYVLKTE